MQSDDGRTTGNLTEAATLFGYSRRQLYRYRKLPGFPLISSPTGRSGREVLVDLTALSSWLIKLEIRKHGLMPGTVQHQRLIKIDEETRQLRLENDRREAQLAPVEDFRKISQAAINLLRHCMKGVAAKLADGDELLEVRLRGEYQRILENFTTRFEPTVHLIPGKVDGAAEDIDLI